MSVLGRLVRAFVKVVAGIAKAGVLLALLGVTTVLAGWFTMRYLIVGEEAVVPEVVGLTQAQAEELLKARGLYVAVKTSRYHEEARENVILEQEPAPGHRLKVHKRVHVVTSKGSRKLTVPDLAGLTLAQARVRINEADLEMGPLVSARSSTVVEGAIVTHDPPAGVEYFKGSPVTLLVSAGAEEIAFVMPDLIGRNVDDVMMFLQDAGLRLGDIHEEDYEGVDPGTITRQEPRAGGRVAAQDIISLSVVRTPSLFGEPEPDGAAGTPQPAVTEGEEL